MERNKATYEKSIDKGKARMEEEVKKSATKELMIK